MTSGSFKEESVFLFSLLVITQLSSWPAPHKGLPLANRLLRSGYEALTPHTHTPKLMY